jgi:nicotinamide-nucleotide amidase
MITPVAASATIFPPALVERAAALIEVCRSVDVMIATAESCTGGLVAALLTEISGSSAVVDRGFVTYSNEAKADLLSVPWATLQSFGAVSAETAIAMAAGALNHSRASLTIAITGIAGPGGGTADKPIGLVHFALGVRGGSTVHVEKRFGPISRLGVRIASVEQALTMLELELNPS